MDNLHDIVLKAVDDLTNSVKPRHEEEDRLRLQMGRSISLTDNLGLVRARVVVHNSMANDITSQKLLVEAAVSKYEQQHKLEEKTQGLVTTFFHFIKTLESDCGKIRQDIQACESVITRTDALDKRKQDLNQEETQVTAEIQEMKTKDNQRKNMLQLAWNVMSHEISTFQEQEHAH